ncbi:unnamed protein product [Adineta steineri]|uniref:G-protein coupled receptors family 1 profile domain-containing protein n=1 Tax=Adineta steineri TaxID=433720 RepID=A0A815REY6_9BILA|nr:unnamed protein product [Adineta steineri]CAF1637336.1 unnamed protein product [Adineta steineri]
MSSSILTILGDIGNIFIVIIFLRHRQNGCAIYLISAAILNSVYITFNRFVQYFPFYYSDETLRAFILCKIRLYLPSIIGQLAKTMIVCACIDHFMITTNRVTVRAFKSLISDCTMLNKSVQYLQTENFLLFLAFLFLTINSFSPFFIYLTLSKPFREDLKQLIICVYRQLRRPPPIRSIHRTNEALVRDTRL